MCTGGETPGTSSATSKARKVTRETQDLPVRTVPRETREYLVPRDLRAFRDRRVHQEQQDQGVVQPPSSLVSFLSTHSVAMTTPE
jgi:hypothetical protein